MRWRKLPLRSEDWLPLDQNPLPYAGLLTSLEQEQDYTCRVEGSLPALDGTLYRVGPGRFDRGPDRKRMMLDGDGMVQALSFSGGRVRYRSRFVRTSKLVEEEKAGRFLYPTFSTHGSGPLRRNLGLSIPNQANTTVLEWAGRIWAFDEGQKPYELSPDLGTIGETPPDEAQADLRYHAHWKLDAAAGQVHLLSVRPGPKSVASVVSLAANGAVVLRREIPLPRTVYFHDWFVSANYFAFLLHPAFIDLGQMLRILMGRETFAHAIKWRPDEGSILLVADRHREQIWTLPMGAPWMWHAINAFDSDGVLTCDFIGGDLGGGLGDENSPLFRVMRGEPPGMPEHAINTPRRVRVDIPRGEIEEQIIDDSANFELPCVSATERSRPYTKAYMIEAAAGDVFARSLCQLDGGTLERQRYTFGPEEYCSEPVVCDTLKGTRSRYLLTQVYSAANKTSYFALFDEACFQQGPIATIPLEHHVPLSFHGYWSAAGP